jgi:transketolase
VTTPAPAPKANPSGYAVTELAARDPRILTMTADLSNTLAEFREHFPERYVELGIAETNSVSVAAGLAACGYLPYIFSMAPFGVLKCAEQLRTDADYNHLPVRLVGRLSGLAMGYFGTSHYAVEDIAIARMLANTTVVAPAAGGRGPGQRGAPGGRPRGGGARGTVRVLRPDGDRRGRQGPRPGEEVINP